MPKTTRILPKLLGSAALVGLLALSACETNRTSLFVRGVLPGELDTATGGCTFDPTVDSFLLGGTVDVGLTTGLTLDLAVANQMIARADQSRLSAESNRVTINRAEVRVTSATAQRRARFSTLVTGIVDPSGDGTQPGLGVVSINVLEPELAEQLLQELKLGGTADLVAYVKLFGETLGGNDVETDFFQYPFTACAGCLVAFPRVDGVIDCSSTSTTTTSVCRPGQNVAISCSLCPQNDYCIPPN